MSARRWPPSGNFYGHPTRHLHVTGVTGTNGKTTTTYIVESILKAAGKPAAVLGTIEYRVRDLIAERTTPERRIWRNCFGSC